MKNTVFHAARMIPLPFLLACPGLPADPSPFDVRGEAEPFIVAAGNGTGPEEIRGDAGFTMQASYHSPVILAVGTLAYLSSVSIQNLGWNASPVADLNGNWRDANLLVLNTSLPLDDEILRQAGEAFSSGVTILIDGATNIDTDVQRRVSASIAGIGLSDPVILIRQRDGVPEYRAFNVAEAHEGDASSADEHGVTTIMKPSNQISDALITLLVAEVDASLGEWFVGGSRVAKNQKKVSQSIYKPEISIPLEVRYVGMPCMVGRALKGYKWTGEMVDACDGKMSLSLFYSIDLIRSTPFSGGGNNNADDAKFVRITLDPKTSGGVGWHLAKSPSHHHTWFQSWTERDTWFGPVALKYGVDILSRDPELHLFQNIPANTPRHQTVTDNTGFTVGVSGSASLEVGGEGPKVGAGVSASYSYSSTRSVTYDVNEYTIDNHSFASESGDRASWTWDRKFDQYWKDWRINSIDVLWGTDWFWKDSAFTAAAYANFKPGMSATFRVSANKRGSSRLTLRNSVAVVAMAGKIQYYFFYQLHDASGYFGTNYVFNRDIKVNWDSPVFDPDVPVSIEPFRYDSSDGMCLNVLGDHAAEGSSVGIHRCHYRTSQLWGFDSMQRYRSKVAPDLCLEVSQEEKLTVSQCDASARQKWRWEENALVNELGKKLALVNDELVVSDSVSAYQSWKSYVHRVGAANALVFD